MNGSLLQQNALSLMSNDESWGSVRRTGPCRTKMRHMNPTNILHRSLLGLAAGVLLVLGGCGGDSNTAIAISSGSGFLTLRVTDAPVDDAAEVVVVFTGVELQRTEEDSIIIDFAAPRSIDLLQFRNGQTANLIEGSPVPPGEYQGLRLRISAEQNLQNGSRIRLRDGRQFPLFIPSFAQSGLKLNRRFTVAQGNITRLLIDFDLRKSIVAPPGLEPNWILRPSLRLVDELQVGTLTGTVDVAALATAQQRNTNTCRAGVYVFAGSNVTPDDMDGIAVDGIDPVAYRPVIPSVAGAPTNYNIEFLEVGDYTVAFTCDFNVDADPTISEFDPSAPVQPGGRPAMQFITKPARIVIGSSTRVDAP